MIIIPSYPIRFIYIITGWWFQTLFMFYSVSHDDPNWPAHCWDGLKPPTSFIYDSVLEEVTKPTFHGSHCDLRIEGHNPWPHRELNTHTHDVPVDMPLKESDECQLLLVNSYIVMELSWYCHGNPCRSPILVVEFRWNPPYSLVTSQWLLSSRPVERRCPALLKVGETWWGAVHGCP
jgi:hypothetical protein